MERPFPVPGWTLPGVMMAGAAQILLKTAGVIPQGRTVLAGCGPLLWLVAWQLLRAGAASTRCSTRRRAAGSRAGAARMRRGSCVSPYFAQGTRARAHGAPARARRRIRDVARRSKAPTAAHAVRFGVGGAQHTLPADHVLLHQGVVPDVNLASAAGCALAWNDLQACFAPVVDAWGGTTVPGLYVAGDGAGIAGASAAEARGRLTALGGRQRARPHRRRRARPRRACGRRRDLAHRIARPLVPRRAVPAGGCVSRFPTATRSACRCEEVPAAAITNSRAAVAPGPTR